MNAWFNIQMLIVRRKKPEDIQVIREIYEKTFEGTIETDIIVALAGRRGTVRYRQEFMEME